MCAGEDSADSGDSGEQRNREAEIVRKRWIAHNAHITTKIRRATGCINRGPSIRELPIHHIITQRLRMYTNVNTGILLSNSI